MIPAGLGVVLLAAAGILPALAGSGHPRVTRAGLVAHTGLVLAALAAWRFYDPGYPRPLVALAALVPIAVLINALAVEGAPDRVSAVVILQLGGAGCLGLLLAPLPALPGILLILALLQGLTADGFDARQVRAVAATAAVIGLLGMVGPGLSESGEPALAAGVLIACAAGLVAGAVPFIRPLPPEDRSARTALAWFGLLGAFAAPAVVWRFAPQVPRPAGAAMLATLLALGMVTALWAAYRCRTATGLVERQRHALLGDIGLLLIGLSLPAPASLLAVIALAISLTTLRLPLSLGSDRDVGRISADRLGPRLWLVAAAAALIGLAPFSGFTGRLQLVLAAVQLQPGAPEWRLAVALGGLIFAQVPGSYRLARDWLREGRGRWAPLVVNAGLSTLLAVAGGWPA